MPMSDDMWLDHADLSEIEGLRSAANGRLRARRRAARDLPCKDALFPREQRFGGIRFAIVGRMLNEK